MTKTVINWLLGLCLLVSPFLSFGQCDNNNVFSDNGTQYVRIDGDEDQQIFNLFTDADTDANYTYALTGSDFNIIRFLEQDDEDVNGSQVDVSLWPADKYFVWGFHYTGDINLIPGDLVFTGSFSTGCFQISNTALVIEKIIDGSGQPNVLDQFFVSSNTQANIGVFSIFDNNTIGVNTFASAAADADGIHYDEDNDVLYQLNRADNVINAYSNVLASLANGMMPQLTATSTSDFSNGREIAVSNGKLVVAQDANDSNDGNKFYVYSISPTSITLDNTYDTSINLWGVHATGSTLYAIVDNSDQLAIFNNFFTNEDGAVEPDAVVTVEGIVRTHGLTYISARDMMILTDVGSGADPADGAFTVVRSFMAASADGTISANEQIRVEGSNTLLGNPVDVAYSMTDNMVYIAERANGGGQVLGFGLPAMGTQGGNIAPNYRADFAGASAITLPNEEDEVPFDDGGDGCDNLVEGGTVARPDGSTEVIFPYAGDGVPDVVMVDSMDTHPNANYTYIVTGADGTILGIPPADMANVDGAGAGNCRVYGLSYTGNLTAMLGQDINSAMLSDGCFDLSDNWVTTVRSQANIQAQLFVSSNTSGNIGLFNIMDTGDLTMNSFASAAVDADGVHYDEDNDVLYQLNRTDNVINAYSNVVSSLLMGQMPQLTATSTSDFSNGREIAVSNGKLVVAQDANDSNDGNKFYVYSISPTSITLDNTYDATINLWGVHATGSTLYAIVDNSDQLAIYNNFFDNADGTVEPSNVVSVEGIIRTHGLTYISARDMMILTDVGSGANPEDGAFTVVRGFMTASADGTISADEQIRIEGDATFLGNPVDVAYSESDDMVYIAERANGGGRVLGFSLPAPGSMGGNIAPDYNTAFAGASAVTLPNQEDEVPFTPVANLLDQFFVSSNTQATIGLYKIFDDGSINASSFNSVAADADGIHYDEDNDVLYQLNRADNVINAYSNVLNNLNMGMMPTLTATSTSDFSNGREIAVSNGKLVVAQDANDSNDGNKFYVYSISPTSITLDNTYDATINLWGIHATGSTLYAIVDNSDQLAIYNNFFDNDNGTVEPNLVVSVEGIVRTHGLTYISARDMMILTDVGSGADPEDGAFTVVRGFTNTIMDGTISADEQIRIEGDATFLGNPVDVAYSESDDMVYIAERANGGGRVLGFSLPAPGSMGGNIAPNYNSTFAGASGINIPNDEDEVPFDVQVVDQFFVSSNTQANIGWFRLLDNGTINASSFATLAADADGIHYDEDNDVLYQLNRADNVINAYSNVVTNLNNGLMPTLTATSSSDFTNGREIAVTGDRLIVAQDAADSNNGNRFYVYQISATSINLLNKYNPGINLWGIHASGGNLFAVEDNSDRLAVFMDFFNNDDGDITPTRLVTIEGIVRTHGLTYVSSRDMMIMTDVGSGADPEDGAFTVITNFMNASSDGTVMMNEQRRIGGSATLLGNPVDVAYSNSDNMIYIAERANGGGRVLGFNFPSSSTAAGNIAPAYNVEFAGASAITFPNNEDEIDFEIDNGGNENSFTGNVFASSNTEGMVRILNILGDNGFASTSFPVVAQDADGIYYDSETDVLYQLNRTDNVINAYSNVLANLTAGMNPELTATSTSDFSNGREIAVSGNRLVVAQDANDANGGQNRLIVYTISPTEITLVNSFDVNFNLWGIQLSDDILFAIQDNTNNIAVFSDFFNNVGDAVVPSIVGSVEGIVRTHGLTYNVEEDMMILTDVGSGMDPEDGAFTVIRNFITAGLDGNITLAEQVRIEGDATELGNPVDVAYDPEHEMIYIAERANEGGKILRFTLPTESGNAAPRLSTAFPGASAVFFSGDDYEGVIDTPDSGIANNPAIVNTLTLFPNPVVNQLTINWKQETSQNANTTVRIIDNQGREVVRQTTSTVQGLNQIQLEVSQLATGIYQVVVNGQTPQAFVKR